MGIATRLSDKDTLVGLGVALGLIVAMGAIFAYERTQFGEYPLTWSAVEVGSETNSGNADVGTPVPYTVEITASDLVRVRAGLTWTDGDNAPDTFRLEIRDPDGNVVDGVGSSGSIDVAMDVNPMPTQATGPGRSSEAAADQAGAEATTTAGTGTWTVTVLLEQAPGLVVGGQTVQPDGTNAFSLTIAWDSFAVTAGPDKV